MLTRCQSRQLPKGRQASIIRRDGNFGAAGGMLSATIVPSRDRGSTFVLLNVQIFLARVLAVS